MTRDRVSSTGVSGSAAGRLPGGGRGSPQTGSGGRTAAQRRELLTLVAMCLGVMMTFLLVTAAISALSAIQDGLHVGPGALIWIPSAYTLVVAALVLSAGTLGNLFGRKRMFCVGVVIMIAGGLLAATSDTTATVILAQLVSGVGGALILPNSLDVLGAAFADPQRRTEVITVWAASSGIGLAVGPLLTGVLLNHFSWHAVSVSNPVLGAITLLAGVPCAAEARAPDGRLDVAGALLGTLTIASLVYALIQGGQDRYTAGPVIAAWGAAAVGAVVFVVGELRVPAPMLDVRVRQHLRVRAVVHDLRPHDRAGGGTARVARRAHRQLVAAATGPLGIRAGAGVVRRPDCQRAGAMFVENPLMTWRALEPLNRGELRLPFADHRLAPVAGYDVAELSVKILTDPASHISKSHDLTGPELKDMHGFAEDYAAVLGRPVIYVPEDVETWNETYVLNLGDLIDQAFASLAAL